MDGNSTHWYGNSCNIFLVTVFSTNICIEGTCEYPLSWYAGQDIKKIPPQYKYCSYWIIWYIKLNLICDTPASCLRDPRIRSFCGNRLASLKLFFISSDYLWKCQEIPHIRQGLLPSTSFLVQIIPCHM